MEILDKIITEVKKQNVFDITPYEYEQETTLENIVLSITGLTKESNGYYEFIHKLKLKMGLFIGDPEDNAEIVAYEIMQQMGIVTKNGYNTNKKISIKDIKENYTQEYWDEDKSTIIEYFKNCGFKITKNLKSTTSLTLNDTYFKYDENNVLKGDDDSKCRYKIRNYIEKNFARFGIDYSLGKLEPKEIKKLTLTIDDVIILAKKLFKIDISFNDEYYNLIRNIINDYDGIVSDNRQVDAIDYAFFIGKYEKSGNFKYALKLPENKIRFIEKLLPYYKGKLDKFIKK